MLPWIRKINFLFGSGDSGVCGKECPCKKIIALESENRNLKILLDARTAVIKELKRYISDVGKQRA